MVSTHKCPLVGSTKFHLILSSSCIRFWVRFLYFLTGVLEHLVLGLKLQISALLMPEGVKVEEGGAGSPAEPAGRRAVLRPRSLPPRPPTLKTWTQTAENEDSWGLLFRSALKSPTTLRKQQWEEHPWIGNAETPNGPAPLWNHPITALLQPGPSASREAAGRDQEAPPLFQRSAFLPGRVLNSAGGSSRKRAPLPPLLIRRTA